MNKKALKALTSIVAAGSVMAGFVAPAFAQEAAPAATKAVTVGVYADQVGGGTFYTGSANLDSAATILDAVKAAVGDANVFDIPSDWGGQYLAGFEIPSGKSTSFSWSAYQSTHGTTYAPDLIHTSGTYFDATHAKPTTPYDYTGNKLTEAEFTGVGGWMLTVNSNVCSQDQTVWYNVNTPLSDLPDNAVINLDYSLNSGADLGLNNACYMPTGLSGSTSATTGLSTFNFGWTPLAGEASGKYFSQQW